MQTIPKRLSTSTAMSNPLRSKIVFVPLILQMTFLLEFVPALRTEARIVQVSCPFSVLTVFKITHGAEPLQLEVVKAKSAENNTNQFRVCK